MRFARQPVAVIACGAATAMNRPIRVAIAPRCSGLGHVGTWFDHSLSCLEVACDLRYLPADFDWNRVVIAYAARGESLDGNDRAS